MTASDPYYGMSDAQKPRVHWIVFGLVAVHVLIGTVLLLCGWARDSGPYVTGRLIGLVLTPFVLYLCVTGLAWVLTGRSRFMPNLLLCVGMFLAWSALAKQVASARAAGYTDPVVVAELARQRESLMQELARQYSSESTCTVDEVGLKRYREATAKAGVPSMPFEAQYRTMVVVRAELKERMDASVEAWNALVRAGSHFAFTIRSEKQLDERIEHAREAIGRVRGVKSYLEEVGPRMTDLLTDNGVEPMRAAILAGKERQAMAVDSMIEIANARVRLATKTAQILRLLKDHWGHWTCSLQTPGLISTDVTGLAAQYKSLCAEYESREDEMDRLYDQLAKKRPAADGQSADKRGKAASAKTARPSQP